MFDWFTKRAPTLAVRQPSRTAERLRAYPPYDPPHAGPPARWTDTQARENLSHLLAHRDTRLADLAAWLEGEDIDVRPALDGGAWQPALDHLHQWANDNWPALHDPRIATDTVWSRTTYRGDEIVYALTFDIALLIGEVVIRRDPRFRWDVNFDEVDGRDGMASYRRVVLRLDAPAPAGCPPVTEDVEAMVVHHYQHPKSQLNRRHNGWARLVQDALGGALDPR